MASVQNVTQGINADILTNMKSSKNVLSKVDEDRKDAVEKSKAYFKEVLQTSTDIKDNVAKGINVDVTTWEEMFTILLLIFGYILLWFYVLYLLQ